jgi:hypothetical protein
MEDLLRFLEQYEAWIYALLGVVGFIYFRKLISEWQEWRSSVFGLERESAQRRLSATLAVVVILSLLATAEFILVSFVAPVYPVANMLQTPTVSVLTTPAGTFAVAGETEPEEISPLSTQAVVEAGGCAPGLLEWSFPQTGDSVSGVVKLKGTANLYEFRFFQV